MEGINNCSKPAFDGPEQLTNKLAFRRLSSKLIYMVAYDIASAAMQEGTTEDVLVVESNGADVAALTLGRWAHPVALIFRPFQYLALYEDGEIRLIFPIRETIAPTASAAKDTSLFKVAELLGLRADVELQAYLLGPVQVLDTPIRNDYVSPITGRVIPFCLGEPRYTTYTRLTEVRFTSELIEADGEEPEQPDEAYIEELQAAGLPVPPDELSRLQAVLNAALLDTAPEADYDNLTKLASLTTETPFSVISLIDDHRQWYKSRHGVETTQVPRSESFCQYAIMGDDLMVVENALEDARFSNNPHVAGEGKVRFYAGAPISDQDGYKVGTLCVFDSVPKKLTESQRVILRALASEVSAKFQLRRKSKELTRLSHELTHAVTDATVAQYALARVHEKLTDSILYASDLQRTFLPSVEGLQAALPNSFVLWCPRDGVTGDFFWHHQVDKKSILAVVDCSGHGVPGALMSLLVQQGLDTLRKRLENEDLGQILCSLNNWLSARLHTGNHIPTRSEGLDISLIRLDRNSLLLEYTTAHARVLLHREENLQVLETRRQALGGNRMEPQMPFKAENIQLQASDRIYLASDGLADQFGGPKHGKFSSARLHQELIASGGVHIRQQGELIEKAYMGWRNSYRQTDDILLIGLEV